MDKRVYPISSAENNHMIAIQQRPKLYESLGMNYAAQHIKDEIKRQGIKIDAFDLYSCFPAAIKMFSKSLGLDENENKSITGSMAYAGGPLNSFVLHSTVRMIQKIRNLEVNYGLVTGVSGMMTKQSFCIWGKKYKESFVHKDVTDKAKIKEIPIKLSNIDEGEGVIVGYTIFKNDKGTPIAILYVEDQAQRRKILSSNQNNFLNMLKKEEWVGRKVKFKDGKVIH